MKILIWISKEDILANKITKHHYTRPDILGRHENFLQVEITQDEFAQLEDVEPFNEEADHIYGYNKDTGLAFKREEGNKYQTQQVSLEDYINVKGKDFYDYWSALTEEQKLELKLKFNW